MPIKCFRPLCSATVFSCNAVAGALDTYTVLEPYKLEYSRNEFLELDLEKEAKITINPLLEHRHKYNYIVVGAPSGGAAQLSTILKAPLLPCNFLTPVKRVKPGKPDDVDSYLNESLELAQEVSRRLDEEADILIHYDPIHDRGWITKDLTIRIHYKKLPRTYKEVIKETLRENGVIIYINVSSPWIQFRFNENIYVQIGGADDLEDWEYIEESPSISKYREVFDIEKYPWTTSLLEEAEKTSEPESEWGSRKELLDDVMDFACRNNYEFIVIDLDNFYKTMILGTIAYLANIGEYRGVVVENYKQSSSTLPLKLKYLPIWVVFTTKKSLEYLRRILDNIVEETRGKLEETIYVTVPYGYREQGTRWPDTTSISDWIKLLRKYADKVKIIPSQITKYDSTRTINVMNKIYEETYKLGQNIEIPRYAPRIDFIREIYEKIQEILS